MTRTRIAVVQPQLELGEVDRNLRRVEALVRDAAMTHLPDVVVLPEALGSPNVYHPDLRSVPRPVDGPLLQMLIRLARELDCIITGGGLAVRGAHAYGTYVMAEPDGAAHLHDKDQPSGTECWDYRAGNDDGITASSAWGGVPVGLASGFEWGRSATARRLRAAGVQVVLGGQCWPWTPLNWRGPIGRHMRRDHAESIDLLNQMVRHMARMTGAPVAMASHVGRITMRTPYVPGLDWVTDLVGQSQVLDRDGTVLARLSLDDGEGHIAADVDLAAPTPYDQVPERYWTEPLSPALNASFRALNVLGAAHYRLRHARRGFPWQAYPSADLPDEWPPTPASDTPHARTGAIRRLPPPSNDRLINAIVARRREIADRVVELTFERADGRRFLGWEAGAHIDVVLEPGLVRQYSLCGDPGEMRRWTVAVLLEHDGRGGSARAHQLQEGDAVLIRGPRNHFARAESVTTLFIAGGIGITPIAAHARLAHSRGDDWRLVYGGRSRSAMAYVDELEKLAPTSVHVCCEDEDGMIDLDAVLADLAPDHAVYACGPAGLLEALEARVPAGQLHVERFSARPLPADLPRVSFDVELAQTGTSLHVPEHATVLEAVRIAGLDPPASCQNGVCGSCRTRVLEGAIQHRDSVLTADERDSGDTMMICVSRSEGGRLVLDL